MDFWQPNSPLGGLAHVKTSRSNRSSSWDRTGGNRDFEVVEPGATFSIEHGHANDQGNDYSSVAYWYQDLPHGPHPDLRSVAERLPRRWPEHGLWDE